MKTDKYILNAKGEAVPEPSLIAWAKWIETADRHIADDGFPLGATGLIRVSTVFLGLDHSFGAHGPPVLWETMVFGGLLDGEMARYTSKADAQAGHLAMVERVRATLPEAL